MEYSDQIKNRMRRIEGQLRGILRMMEENKECKDVITSCPQPGLELIGQSV